MKKIAVAVLMSTYFLAQADVIVYNQTDYPIKFGMSWIGKTAYNCSNILDPNCWADSTTWSDVIKPHSIYGKAGELVNIKTGYTIQADMTGKGDWKTVIQQSGLSDDANRVIIIAYDSQKGWTLQSVRHSSFFVGADTFKNTPISPTAPNP